MAANRPRHSLRSQPSGGRAPPASLTSAQVRRESFRESCSALEAQIGLKSGVNPRPLAITLIDAGAVLGGVVG
jgi:hypothetical protein